ncbi:MAG: hypothetical protein Q7T77_03850 [Sulfuricurvum sp.]|nr:hypothetical protein [Sulfuricurvum sp.]
MYSKTQKYGRIILFTFLLALTTNANELHWAIDGKASAFKDALETGANVNEKNVDGTTPLLYAAGSINVSGGEQLKILELLIDKGADVNVWA